MPIGTVLTSDTLRDWADDASGWVVVSETPPFEPDRLAQLGLRPLEGRTGLCCIGPSGPERFDAITRLMADPARNKGNRRSLLLWVHDVEKVTLRTGYQTSWRGGTVYVAESTGGPGWHRCVIPVDAFKPKAATESLRSWNEVPSLGIVGEPTAGGTAAVGLMAWE